jgi:hypothetical protein
MGGITVANGKAVFPNAVVRADAEDADYWLSGTSPMRRRRYRTASTMPISAPDAGIESPGPGDQISPYVL